ncbi:hypothetical protein EE612_048151, partial [Oryza sativa]
AGGGAGSGKLPMVPVGSIECLRKRCRQLRVLIHVNDHRKAVVVLHAGEDGKPDHVLVQNVSPEGEASVQSTYRIDVSGETPESQAEMLNDWYTSFRMDTTGVLYDSDQNVIYGVPRGHPGGDVPRSLAILPSAPKKNQHGKAPATESNSSLVEEPLLLVQTDQPAAIGKRKKFTFPDQRKRVKTMTKKDLESYFHITQKSAAHIGLSIGTTALKNLCRANDLPRWPYRQIASLDNKFNNNLKKQITGWNLGKAVQGVTKAFKLRKEKEEFYQKIMSSMPEQLQNRWQLAHRCSTSSNVPSDGVTAGGGAGSGKLPMVPLGSIECLRKRCRQLRVLIHVNDHRKMVVVLHAGEDGKLDHILVQNNSPDAEASVQSTYRINACSVSGETPELQAEMLNDWYTSFRMDTTGVLYDSDQNVIYGVPKGHPGGDVPRSLAILPPAPKKNQHGKAPTVESNSSLIARLENKFNNNLKKRITEWNLGKVQGVTKAFKLRKEKEQFYQKK